jgi:hypothetical protein
MSANLHRTPTARSRTIARIEAMERVQPFDGTDRDDTLEETGLVVELVTFATGLGEEDVLRTIEERAPDYRSVPGLVQKLYIRDPETGEYGGIYVWENAAASGAFRDSELARTIPSAYRVDGRPRVRSFEIVAVL